MPLFTPADGDGALRLDVFLTKASGVSREAVRRAIENGGVARLEGEARLPVRPSDKAREGAVYVMEDAEAPRDERAPVAPADIPLDAVYEDAHLLVINKPAGMTVHPGAGTRDDTVANALLWRLGAAGYEGGDPSRPGVVHRLDRETSGLMLLAKHEDARRRLSALIQARDVTREYLALCKGAPSPRAGTVEAPLGRHPVRRKEIAVRDDGRPAVTRYRAEETFHGGDFAAVACRLETGRTHQIRVHLRHIGCPLIGDPLYGPRTLPLKRMGSAEAAVLRGFSRQALHARFLAFVCPFTGEERAFTAPLPDDMAALLAALRAA